MRPRLSTAEVAAIHAIARGVTHLPTTPRIEAPLLELDLVSRRGRALTVTAAGDLGGNPLFEHWL